jgi:hypothetical protein
LEPIPDEEIFGLFPALRLSRGWMIFLEEKTETRKRQKLVVR